MVFSDNAKYLVFISQFLALCHHAAAYYEGLTARRLDARSHLRKILALAQIYGNEATARAVEDALSFNAFSSEYIAHLLQARARSKTEPISPLSLTRRADLLELIESGVRDPGTVITIGETISSAV